MEENVHRYHATASRRQGREYRALLASRHRDDSLSVADLERSEHRDVDGFHAEIVPHATL
jgi:hypothetical protein